MGKNSTLRQRASHQTKPILHLDSLTSSCLHTASLRLGWIVSWARRGNLEDGGSSNDDVIGDRGHVLVGGKGIRLALNPDGNRG